MLGRLDPIKRPWVAVEVARRLPEAEFLLLGGNHFEGPGSWQPRDLPPNVRLLGHLDGSEKQELLRRSWALLNTSIHEGLPISFQEALAAGVPLVAPLDPERVVSRFGMHVGEWDGDGLDAVEPLASGLARLLADEPLRTRLGAAGRELGHLDARTRAIRLDTRPSNCAASTCSMASRQDHCGRWGSPRTSVLMPAFNADETLVESIESVLAQRLADLELIVIDDASDTARRRRARGDR